MAKQAYLGNKIRRLRKEVGWTQVQLAEKLEISASYLNLIERNQRALTVPLLLKLADVFHLDLKAFAEDDEARLVAELKELFSDPLFTDRTVRDTDIRDLLANTPVVARAFLDLYREFRTSREDLQALAARLSDDEQAAGVDSSRLPSEEVSDSIQRARNHYPELEEAAERLRRRADLDVTPGDRFPRLSAFLAEQHGIRVEVVPSDELGGAVRRFVAKKKKLLLSEALPAPSLTFQLAHQVGLLSATDDLDALVRESGLTVDESKRLLRVALASYFASAVLMPYDPFLDAARSLRYDIELLEQRFRASFEQVCHRLTTLNRLDNSGIPFHLIRIDIAGNISKRFSGSGIPFARYSGACPLWNVHAAFLTPGMIRTQVSEMPDGEMYFSIARTVRKAGGGHRVRQSRLALELGCDVQYAPELVYADGVDTKSGRAAVPVGVSCRLCERMDCRQRAFPPMHHRLEVNENVRGLSFYFSPRDQD
ncbi:MAG: transcriptional regulator [Gemmatimonadota bacterium]|nr:MAG: transcriptional regulator [Gemmatimonadota bacterium]